MTGAGTWIRVSDVFLLALLVVAANLPAVTPGASGQRRDAALVCVACHGEAGVPIDPAIPVIWGQNEGYLYLQLRDMKAGLAQSRRDGAYR